MPMRLVTPAIGIMSLATAIGVFAQTNSPLPPLSSQYSPGSMGNGFPSLPRIPVVTGEPFHAEVNARRVQIKPDGSQAVYESHDILARDIDGRVFSEHLASPPPTAPRGGSFTPHGASIFDPIAMTQMRWSDFESPTGVSLNTPLSNTIMKSRLNIPGPGLTRGSTRLTACDGDHPAIRTYPYNRDTQRIEDLGERTIQNIPAKGCRVTTSIPGDPVSNKPPDTIIEEVWTSAELGMGLLKTRHDEDTKEDEIVQLDNLVRDAPNPNLFVPPSGYAIKDLDQELEQAEKAKIPLSRTGPKAEELAGAWETEDPILSKGTEFGILLKISADKQLQLQQGTVVSEGPQRVSTLEIRVYQRTGGSDQGGWFSAVPASSNGGASWNGQQLQLNYPGRPGTFTSDTLALDLTFNATDPSWMGSYARNAVSKQIRLVRPGAGLKTNSNSVVGTWMAPQSSGIPGACVRIAQATDGSLVGWRNQRSPVFVRPQGPMTQETDGQPLEIHFENNSITLEDAFVGAITGGGPFRFTGTLSPDGTQIVGSRPVMRLPGLNPAPTPPQLVFTKTTGEFCVN